MAIRYSGDCEVRVIFVEAMFVGRVRTPRSLVKGSISARDVDRLIGDKKRVRPGTPESYDRAALAMLVLAQIRLRKRLPVDRRQNRILIRRVFVSPCPIEDI